MKGQLYRYTATTPYKRTHITIQPGDAVQLLSESDEAWRVTYRHLSSNRVCSTEGYFGTSFNDMFQPV